MCKYTYLIYKVIYIEVIGEILLQIFQKFVDSLCAKCLEIDELVQMIIRNALSLLHIKIVWCL